VPKDDSPELNFNKEWLYMFARLMSGIFGTKNERELKRMQKVVDAINALEPSVQSLR
jgi:preprotein translocase subunit SecA